MSNFDRAASRAAIIARYRPVRASIQRVLAQAVGTCRKADFERAAKHLDLMHEMELDDPEVINMLSDVALFERNQRGRRVVDAFIKESLDELAAGDRDVAQRLGTAFFSIFRVADWHDAAGVWVEDLLAHERRLWLLDEGIEASAQEGMVLAMRVFDAGSFHAGFGIVVQPDALALELCISAASRGRPLPVRHSLAASIYGDAIMVASLRASIEAEDAHTTRPRSALGRARPRSASGRAGRR